MTERLLSRLREALRRYFLAGLLAFAPIGITLWAIVWIIQRLDNLLLPHLIHLFLPSLQKTPDLPPLVGAVFTLLVILLAGVVVRHLFGSELVRLGERILSRVPVAGSIYAGVKQLFEAVIASSNSRSGFTRVVLIEYPRAGLYGLAFVTGPARGALAEAAGTKRLLNCFVPTTPNPTSGFYLLVPEEDVVDLQISVEDAFKVIMSAGLVSPPSPASLRADAGDQLPNVGVRE